MVRPAVAAVAALAALTALAVAPTAARAGGWFVDVEPMAIRRGAEDAQLPSMFTVSVGRVRPGGMLRPYATVGSGLVNVQARLGVMALARGSDRDGPTMLVQLRAMHAIVCGEQGVFAGVGLGYRWWRGGTNPFGLQAIVEAGPARLHPTCGPEVALADAPAVARSLGGGSVSFTVGF